MIRILTDSDAFENTHQHGVRRWLTHVWREMGACSGQGVGRAEDIHGIRSSEPELIPGVHVTMVQGRRLRVSLPHELVKGSDGAGTIMRVDVPPRWMLKMPGDLRKGLLARSQRKRMARLAGEHDVFMATYFSPGPGAGRRGEDEGRGGGTGDTKSIPVVCTLYDMIVERYPEQFEGEFAIEEIRRKRRGMEAADAIVCISEATRAELARVYPHLAGKAVVIHPGADHVVPAGAGDGNRLAGRYVAHVGARAGYKNGSTLFHALARSEWPEGVKLVLIGPALTPEERRDVELLGIGERMISVQNVPDSSMRAFVGRSLGVVSPSLCEGFGFPVVEGQRYGVPVACADTPIYREVAGEGAEFFDPKDSRGLAMAVAGMLEAGRSRELVEAGRENVERFTWRRAGEAHVALVERLKAKGERRK